MSFGHTCRTSSNLICIRGHQGGIIEAVQLLTLQRESDGWFVNFAGIFISGPQYEIPRIIYPFIYKVWGLGPT